MTDILDRARNYVAMNAAESGADVMILDMADEIVRLRAALERARHYIANGIFQTELMDQIDAALAEQDK